MFNDNFIFKLIVIFLVLFTTVQQIYVTIISWRPYSELDDEYKRIVENRNRKYPFVPKQLFLVLFFYSNQPKILMWVIRIMSPLTLIAFLLILFTFFTK